MILSFDWTVPYEYISPAQKLKNESKVKRVIKALWSLQTYSTNRHIMDRHINHMFLRERLFHPITSNGNCFPLFETKKARMLPPECIYTCH